MTQPPRCIKDSLLECYLAGTLAPDVHHRLQEQLASSPADQARLEELRIDSSAFLMSHPPGPLVARYEADRRHKDRWWQWMRVLMPVAAAAGMLFLALPSPPDPSFATKGGVTLTVYLQQMQGLMKLTPEYRLSGGDILRFEVRTEGSGYVALLSRDGRGRVTVYYPYGGDQAVPYTPSQPLLSGAIELDDAPGTEVLYVLYGSKPFALDWAMQALQTGTELERVGPSYVSVGIATLEKK